jgi:hypothetical protein
MDQLASGLFVPDQVNRPEVTAGIARGRPGPADGPAGVVIDNRTDLPDEAIRHAVMAHFTESAAFQFGQPSSFQMYATNQGSILQRSAFQTPSNVVEEIKLARTVAETDDDVQAIIGSAVSTAYRDGMQNLHEDENTVQLFNKVCANANMDAQLKELYREYLLSGQVNSATLFTRQRHSFIPTGTDDRVNAQLATPRIGVLPAENIRVISTDLFGDGELAYDVPPGPMRTFLEELFGERTSPARRAQMRAENPVVASLFTGIYTAPWDDPDELLRGGTFFRLNPRMVHRTTMPKGASPYPRPPLTSNFALLEAKRLLNIMDYSLLQGGTNYIVVAKIGSDQKPGLQPEVDNLEEQVRSAARTGVLVGDHRVSIEIITPELKELLNPQKRMLLGRKLTMALLRIPEQVTEEADVEAELTLMANTITSDRHDIKRHVERTVYEETAERNRSTFKKGPPRLWHQKIVLAGVKDFFDQVVKARDRGDIPRKWAVEVLGFDYEAGVAQRQRETEQGHDEIMIPGSVPFDSPENQLPGDDGGEGRPPGSSSRNGRNGGDPPDPAQRQRRRIPRRRGAEAVLASWDPELQTTVRVGELTASVLEQFPEREQGRVTDAERRAANGREVVQSGPVIAVPVNVGQDWTELRAFRLEDGVSMIVGQRKHDSAIMAAALCFRDSSYTEEQALERAMQWGFITSWEEHAAPEEHHKLKCPKCDTVQSASNRTCTNCGHDLTEARKAKFANLNGMRAILAETIASVGPQAFMEMAASFLKESLAGIQPNVTIVMPEEGEREVVRDENGAVVGSRPKPPEVTS